MKLFVFFQFMFTYGVSILFTSIISLTMGVLCFMKNKRSFVNIFYFLFIICLVCWMGALYLGYFFIDIPHLSLQFIRLTFGFGALGSTCLCAFAYLYSKKSISIPRILEILYIAFTLYVVFISSFTDLIYEREIIINGIEIQDVHGSLHVMFLIHYFLNLFFATACLIKKSFASEGIEHKKIILALFGVLSIVLPTLLFHMILPRFGIYLFQIGVVHFSLLFVGLAGYSILKYRFLDIKFILTRMAQQGIAIVFSVLFVFGLFGLMEFTPWSEYAERLQPIGFLLAILVYNYVAQGLVVDIFNRFFGITNVEYFGNSLNEFTRSPKLYATVKDFNTALKTLFNTFNIDFVGMVPLNNKNQEKYESFINYFEINSEIVVRNERPFLSDSHKNISGERPQELTSLGEICIPLYRSPGELLGFFIIGSKRFNDLYSAEEIKILEDFRRFLELRLIGILYSDYLTREVDKKTKALELKNKELAVSNAKLKELDAVKDTFLSIASHELRTPMTVISGYADLLRSNKFGTVTKEQEKFLEAISQNTKDLTRLVNTMLDISQLEAGKMDFFWERIDVAQVLKKSVESFHVLCAQKEINIQFENPDNIQLNFITDLEKLNQILNNLIGNAIKFTLPKGSITVTLGHCLQRENCICVSVKDTGVGIAEKDQLMIFEKFHQVRGDHVKSYVGTGLGLNIVKLLVKKLGGTIKLTSNLGKGACFTFIIPEHFSNEKNTHH